MMTTGDPRSEQADPELDVAEMLRAVWSNRLLILLITLGCLAGGVVYANLETPEYQATVSLLPPMPADLTGKLRVADTALTAADREPLLTRASAFKRGLLQLSDEQTRETVFWQLNTPVADGRTDEALDPAEFSERIRLTRPRQQMGQSMLLSVRHPDAAHAREAVRLLINQANIDASRLLAEELHYEALAKSQSLQGRYRHAAASLAAQEPGGDIGHLADLAVELQVEIAALADYVNKDYPPVQMFALQGDIETSDGPVSPRKSLVMVMSALGGLLLGLMIATWLAVYQRYAAQK